MFQKILNLNIIFIYYLLHMKMKKMLFGAFLGMFTLAGVAALPVSAQWNDTWANPKDNANLVGNWQTFTWAALLDTVKNAINWILWILATVALVICLYGWFLMVTSAGDSKKYENGLNVLKNAAIGLAIIGLSWMIVSVVFWFINTVWGGNQTQSSGDQTVDTSSAQWTSLRESAWWNIDWNNYNN